MPSGRAAVVGADGVYEQFVRETLGPSAASPDTRVQRMPNEMTTGGRIPVLPGETGELLNITGNGRIREFWMRVQTMEPEAGRTTILRMYWDGETEPSVEAPVADFFGCGMWMVIYDSFPMGQSRADGYYCLLPMPYGKSARITIENQSDKMISVTPKVLWIEDGTTTDATPRFHAVWHRENPTSKKDPWFTIADITGRGEYIGTTIAVQCLSAVPRFYAGEQVYDVDGRASHDQAAKDKAFAGATIHDPATYLMQTYSWGANDPIHFEKSLRVRMATSHDAAYDCATVAYWYQTEPHRTFPMMPAAKARTHQAATFHLPKGAMKAEDLKVVKEPKHGKVFRTKWSAEGLLFDTGAKLEMRTFQPDAMAFTFSVASTGVYDLDMEMLAGPWWGQASFAIDGNAVGGAYNGFMYGFAPRVPFTIPRVSLKAGAHVMTLNATGKDESALGCYVGLDYLVIKRKG